MYNFLAYGISSLYLRVLLKMQKPSAIPVASYPGPRGGCSIQAEAGPGPAALLKVSASPCSFIGAAAAAKSLQSCPTLCDPIDGSPLGSPVHGIFHARVLEWPRDRTRVSCIGRRILYPLSHLDAPSLIDSSRLTGELQEFRKHLGTLSKPEATARLSVCCFSASVSLSFRGGSQFFPGIYTNV